MANLKISELPTDVTTLSSGDKFPIAQASALTLDVFATAAEIKTHTNKAPLWAAGSTSANSKPKLTSGTNLTTIEAGSVEFNDEGITFSTTSAQRNRFSHRHFIKTPSGGFALSNSTAQQAMFTTPNTLTLTTGYYQFSGLVQVTGLSATTGNVLINLIGTGTAVTSNQLIYCVGIDATSPTTPATQTGSWTAGTLTTPASAVTATTGVSVYFRVYGYFTVGTAGTIIPAIAMVTATGTAIVNENTYFMIERIASASTANIGAWA